MLTNNALQSFWVNTGATFPWLSVKETNDIKEKSKLMSSNSYDQMLIENDLYKQKLTDKNHENYMKERQTSKMWLEQQSQNAKDTKTKNTTSSVKKMAALADMYRQYWYEHGVNRDSMQDEELISRFNTKNPQVKKFADDFLTWGQDSEYRLAQELWISKMPWEKETKETWLQKAADVGVWILQSPWKRGYNMIWQWMDKLWKAVADKLEWTDLQKWVQEKAIEAFGEDEVRAFQEQTQKELEEWTAFNGREQTDIRTPLLWEERANSKYTKAWEVIGDIATWIAVSAPLAWALAPAMATQWAWSAALLGAIEWGIDTLVTQYGTQWNLDVTPLQAALGFWLWAIGGTITNKLSSVNNLPKDQVDDITNQAKTQLTKDVKKYVEKSIKPTVKWKLSQTSYDDYMDDVVDWLSDMVKNKELLQYTDDAWEIVTWKLPTNMRETSEAIGNYKKVIYDMYNDIAKKAWDAGARVNLNKVYNQLDDLWDDIAQNIANPWTKNIIDTFKKSLIDYSDDAWTIAIEDAQKLTQDLNKQLTAFFRNPNMNDVSKNAIVANMNKGLKNAINESLDDVLDAGIKNWSTASQQYTQLKRIYGSLSNIEDEVSKRALVEARKNIKWLSDTLLDSFAWWEITDALLTLNPVKATKAWIIKWISSWYNYLNSPNTNIRKLFETIDKAWTPSRWSTIWTKVWNNLAQKVASPNVAPVASTVIKSAKNSADDTVEGF